VIDGLEFQDGRMAGRLGPYLPPTHVNRSTTSEVASRLIEFGLQTAGLLELATSGRMMIPHSIARIQRFVPVDVDHAARSCLSRSLDLNERLSTSTSLMNVSG
jgi:hypothetical protein